MSGGGGRLGIVRAVPSDATAVHAMVRELAAHEGPLRAVGSDEERWAELLADDRVTVLLASIDGEPVGYVSAVCTLHLPSGAPTLAVHCLYVRPAARDAGVGEGLMRALAECGGRAIRWEIEEGDLAAQRCSLRLGARLRRRVVARWEPAPRP